MPNAGGVSWVQGVIKMSDVLQSLKNTIKRTPLILPYRAYQRNRPYLSWVLSGRPIPPPSFVKVRTVKQYGRRFALRTLVETGTCYGDMVAAVEGDFEKVLSVELGEELYLMAAQRFAEAKHVTILHGDSGKVMADILAQVNKPCLFWLDSHYSGGVTARAVLDTPIRDELQCIMSHPLATQHVILIDDARDFTGEGDYPNVQELRSLALASGYRSFRVQDDIIRIVGRHRPTKGL
jgi:hypothetical protein